MLHLLVIVVCVLHFSEGAVLPDFHFALNGSYNETGHWVANVQFSHGDYLPWDVDVYHNTIISKGKRYEVFETKIVTVVSNQTHSPTHHPKLEAKGYQRLPGFGYYKLHTQRLLWGEAVEACREEGTHLLILNSDDEARKVGQLTRLYTVTGQDCWTGVHDIFKEGHYITIFNEPLSTTGFVKWDIEEPSNSTSENCFDFTYLGDHRYGLGDFRCDSVDEFICEYEFY